MWKRKKIPRPVNASPYQRSSFADCVLIARRAPTKENGIDPRATRHVTSYEICPR
jgi:hypothetical protein